MLGLRDYGLEDTAAKVGGRTLLNDPDWMATLQRGVGESSTRLTVSTDAMSGGSAYGHIVYAAQRGAAALQATAPCIHALCRPWEGTAYGRQGLDVVLCQR